MAARGSRKCQLKVTLVADTRQEDVGELRAHRDEVQPVRGRESHQSVQRQVRGKRSVRPIHGTVHVREGGMPCSESGSDWKRADWSGAAYAQAVRDVLVENRVVGERVLVGR